MGILIDQTCGSYEDRICCVALRGSLEGAAGAWLLGKALEAGVGGIRREQMEIFLS